MRRRTSARRRVTPLSLRKSILCQTITNKKHLFRNPTEASSQASQLPVGGCRFFELAVLGHVYFPNFSFFATLAYENSGLVKISAGTTAALLAAAPNQLF
jgi:hypothetical protein